MTGFRVHPLAIPYPPDWMGKAACGDVDPEMFTPDQGGSPTPALRICNGVKSKDPRDARRPCEVREDCLLYALAHNERIGIWGGKTARERTKISRPSRASRYS